MELHLAKQLCKEVGSIITGGDELYVNWPLWHTLLTGSRIVKSCSTLERESRWKHELNKVTVYWDPCLGVILHEVEPTDSRTQEDGVMCTWVRRVELLYDKWLAVKNLHVTKGKSLLHSGLRPEVKEGGWGNMNGFYMTMRMRHGNTTPS